MNTYRKPDDAQARQLVENDIKLQRDFARVLTSKQVRAVLARFNGKTINKRLDTALDQAAGEVVPGSHIFARRGDPCHSYSPFRFNELTATGYIYGAWYHDGGPTVWLQELKPEDIATGATLNADALRRDFDRTAEKLTKEADHARRDLDNIEEWSRKWSDLCTAAHRWIYGTAGDYSDTCAHSVRTAFGMELTSYNWMWDAARDERKH